MQNDHEHAVCGEVADANISNRFWGKVDKRGPDECWPWLGCLSNKYGYFYNRGKNITAHRASFIINKGAIPSGLVIDHICRNRACVNPAHLRAVTHRINSIENSIGPTAKNAAQTVCHKGHEFRQATGKRPQRRCRQCHRELMARWRAKRKIATAIRAITGEGAG